MEFEATDDELEEMRSKFECLFNEHINLKQDSEAMKTRARKMLEDKDDEIFKLKGGKISADSGAS